MKKIVGILAAAAVLATSVFAADVSAMVHGWTDLLNVDLATEGAKPSFMGVRDPFDRQYAWYSTGLGLSVNADKCGGSFELDNRDLNVKNVKVYVQPLDALKITVGSIGLATNAETINYTKLRAFEGKEGWAFDITPVEGLSINTMLVTGEARNWGWAYWGADGKIGETVAKLNYSADFGTVFAMVDYADPVTDISAGYSGNFGSISLFADVAYTMQENANVLGVDAFVNGNADAIGYKAYVKYSRGLDAETNDLCLKLWGQYGLDFGTVYLQVLSPNVLADEFPIQIQPGLQFNIGAASIDAGFQFNMNTDFDANYAAKAMSIRVPVVYRVIF